MEFTWRALPGYRTELWEGRRVSCANWKRADTSTQVDKEIGTQGREDRETRREGESNGVWEQGMAVTGQAMAREERELYDARAVLWREVLRQIAEVDIANMTPVQALNLLNEMQVRIRAMDARD